MKNNQNQNYQEEKLVRCFIALVNSVGYEKINVKLLTESAGINRTTFYQFFSSKTDLAESICYSFLDKHNELLAKSMLQSERNVLHKCLMSAFDYIRQNATTIQALWSIQDSCFSPYLIMQSSMHDTIVKTLCLINKHEDSKMELFAATFAASAMATIRIFLDKGCVNQEEIVGNICACYYQGVFTLLK